MFNKSPAGRTDHSVARPSTNPKDAIGSNKLPLHLWPAEATALGCLGMQEGDEKYGRNNYIAGDGVICSIYIDAAKRHLDAWFSGEECAPDTGSPHLANALASIAIIVKARAHGRMIDDRDYNPHGADLNPWPTTGYRAFIEYLTPFVKRIKDLFKDKTPKRYTIADNPEPVAEFAKGGVANEATIYITGSTDHVVPKSVYEALSARLHRDQLK